MELAKMLEQANQRICLTPGQETLQIVNMAPKQAYSSVYMPHKKDHKCILMQEICTCSVGMPGTERGQDTNSRYDLNRFESDKVGYTYAAFGKYFANNK